MISWLPKSMLLIVRYQSLVGYPLKYSMKIEKKTENVDKKMPNTNGLLRKTYYNTKITEIENNIPSVIGLITTTMLNTKATDVGNKIPDITNLATKAALDIKSAEVESKIPEITDLVTKHPLNTKASDIKNKAIDTIDFITTPEFNRLKKKEVLMLKWKTQKKSLATKSQADNVLDVANTNEEKIKKT